MNPSQRDCPARSGEAYYPLDEGRFTAPLSDSLSVLERMKGDESSITPDSRGFRFPDARERCNRGEPTYWSFSAPGSLNCIWRGADRFEKDAVDCCARGVDSDVLQHPVVGFRSGEGRRVG